METMYGTLLLTAFAADGIGGFLRTVGYNIPRVDSGVVLVLTAPFYFMLKEKYMVPSTIASLAITIYALRWVSVKPVRA